MEGLLQKAGPEIAVLEDVRPIELARAARVCITKSGTVTLEIASQHTPMVVFYRATPFACFMAYGLADVPYLGLINLLAGRMICPEKLMLRSDPLWLTGQVVRLLREPGTYQRCRQAIQETLSSFAQPGASARAARSALDLIGQV